jgi:hypothetical protein
MSVLDTLDEVLPLITVQAVYRKCFAVSHLDRWLGISHMQAHTAPIPYPPLKGGVRDGCTGSDRVRSSRVDCLRAMLTMDSQPS